VAIRPVRIYGDPILRRKSAPVTAAPETLRTLVADMFDTMYDEPGIGLAAPQIGVSLRVLVVAAVADDEDGDHVGRPTAMINPEVLSSSSATMAFEEGCLSVPDVHETVERPRTIRFRYTTLEGETIERDAAGLLARVVQHEMDHLEGILFVDRLSLVKRQLLRKKLARLASAARG
jgi:peptide deformylase